MSQSGPEHKAEHHDRSPTKYQQVKHWILARIERGEFTPDKPLPAEHLLMEIHSVSRGTIRQAMFELQHEGKIRRTPGRGTFILDQHAAPKTVASFHWSVLCRYRHDHGDFALAGLEEAAVAAGARVTVEYVGDDPRHAREAVKRILDRKPAGAIVEPLPYEPDAHQVYRPLFEMNLPVVQFSQPLDHLNGPIVVLNHRLAARQIAQHLVDLGHRRIAYISSPRYWTVDQQVGGLCEFLNEAGIPSNDELFRFETEFTDRRGFDAMRQLLALPKPPTAVVALNAIVAANAYRAIRSAGLAIPKDISVVAVTGENQHLPEALDPPLTVWCPWTCSQRLGRTAGELLGQLVQNHRLATPQVLIDPAPLPRGSVALAP